MNFPGSLAIFITKGSNFYLNTTKGLSAQELSPSNDYPGYSDNANNPQDITSSLTIDGFAPASAYLDSYNSKVVSQIDNLILTSRGLDPSLGAGTSQQIVIISYINLLRDLALQLQLFIYNIGKLSILVTNILNSLDYIINLAQKLVID